MEKEKFKNIYLQRLEALKICVDNEAGVNYLFYVHAIMAMESQSASKQSRAKAQTIANDKRREWVRSHSNFSAKKQDRPWRDTLNGVSRRFYSPAASDIAPQ